MTSSKHTLILTSLVLVAGAAAACVYATGLGNSFHSTSPVKPLPTAAQDLTLAADAPADTSKLVLAGGCFWCTEAVFEQLEGVKNVVSGYAGGNQADANYQSVSAGLTDHAEAIEITYDPQVISYGTLLKVFFSSAHDPTQSNRQGPDYGRQYRSAIFYQTPEEKEIAAAYIRQVNHDRAFLDPIATTLEPFEGFYPAEEYHQDFVQKHPDDYYVQSWSLPKVRKTCELFPDRLRRDGETVEPSQP
jgi:peptide-methionine (S)-S-oxide reductase